MENKSHAFAAGIFVTAMLALLVALAVWLARDNTEHRVFELSSRESVTGLQPQAGVRYKGVSVGRVTAIELDRQTTGHVLVRIAVADNAPITESTYGSLGFQGVTGLAFVQLDDTGESPKALPTRADAPGRIPMRPGLMARLSDQGTQLLGQLDQVGQRANLLLDADNQKRLMQAVDNLSLAAAQIAQLARRTDQLMGAQAVVGQTTLPQLMQEASATLQTLQSTAERLAHSGDTVRASAAELRRVSSRMNEPGGTLDRIGNATSALVATGQSLNTTLVPRLNRTVDDTARAVRQVGRAADAVSENPQSLLLGKGALLPGPGESGFVPPARTAPP